MKFFESIKNMFKSDIKWHLSKLIIFLVVFIVAWLLIMGTANLELICIAIGLIILFIVVKKCIS